MSGEIIAAIMDREERKKIMRQKNKLKGKNLQKIYRK